jgi:hypothetical protein
MPDFWSNPDLQRANNFITFEAPGDMCRGVVTALRTQTFIDNGVTKVSPQIDLDTDDGPRTLTAGQTRLQLLLLEHRPQIGDVVTITMTGVQRRPGGKTLKEFEVTVQRSDDKPMAFLDEAPLDPAGPPPTALL